MPNLTQRFNAIDHNQIASNRQIYAVAAHFANIQAGTPSDRFPLTKVFYAIIRKYYEQFDCKMTHGEATDYLENWQEVPEEFKSQLRKITEDYNCQIVSVPKLTDGPAVTVLEGLKYISWGVPI